MTINWSDIIKSGQRVVKAQLRDGLQQITNLLYGIVNGTQSFTSLLIEAVSTSARLIIRKGSNNSSTLETHSASSSTALETHLTFDFNVPTGSGSQSRIARFRAFRFSLLDLGVVEIFRGNNTSELAHSFRSDGEAYLGVSGSRRVAVGHTSPACSLDVGGQDGVLLPRGTTAQRPTSPVQGLHRFNTETKREEIFVDSTWLTIPTIQDVVDGTIEPAIQVSVQKTNGGTLSPNDAYERIQIYEGRKIRFVRTVVEVTGNQNTVVYLPNVSQGAYRGLAFLIQNRTTGTLTISVPTGSLINDADSIAVPYSLGTVEVVADSVSGNNVFWSAVGDTSSGITLPSTAVVGDLLVTGEVTAGLKKMGPKITSNTTLTDDDVGVLRFVEGSSITVTVPSTFLGSCELHYLNSGTLAFQGGTTNSISANTRVVVEVRKIGTTTYRYFFDAPAKAG